MHKTLDKYEILNLLGSGGYADVYHARDTKLGREVALKVLHAALVMDGTSLARFHREGQVLAGLVHPYIAFAWEFGQAEGRIYIATRYIAGPSLDRLLTQDGPLAWKDSQQILEQIGSALEFAHRKGIIHRDVKPANILVGKEEGAVLTDFGLVKALQSSGLTTTGSQFMGTPAYIPPEIWLGEEATPACDQYALACVLGEMLSGRALFTGDTPPAIMTRHVLSGPILPSIWPADVPDGFTAALSKALSRDPKERFSNLKDFVDAVKALSPVIPLPNLPEVGRADDLETKQITQTSQQKPQVGLHAKNITPPNVQAEQFVPDENYYSRGVTDKVEKAAQDSISNDLIIELAPGIVIEFVRIPAGEFLMGSDNSTFMNIFDDETPQNTLFLPEYLISKYPITLNQFRYFVQINKYKSRIDKNKTKREYHPVTNVSWDDAVNFCQWVSYITGRGVRLPSEAEWEKAARGTDGQIFPWGNQPPDDSRCNYNLFVGITTAVGQYSPKGDSPYGCADMAGNVWEWTLSLAKSYPYDPNDGREDPGSRSIRILRGGSFSDDANIIRCSCRSGDDPEHNAPDIGFRIIIPGK